MLSTWLMQWTWNSVDWWLLCGWLRLTVTVATLIQSRWLCSWLIDISLFVKDAFVKIARNEGITALWSGLPPTLWVLVARGACRIVVVSRLCISVNVCIKWLMEGKNVMCVEQYTSTDTTLLHQLVNGTVLTQPDVCRDYTFTHTVLLLVDENCN